MSSVMYISNWGNDIRIITDYLNENGIYPTDAKVVADAYGDFCGEVYSAGWLIISESTLKKFVEWILNSAKERGLRFEYLCD